MESYLIYIGKAALAAGTFYLLYLALFQHQKQFVFNRIYLPVSLAISFLIPLITFTTVKYIEPIQSLPINSFAYLPEATEFVQPEFVYQWYHYLTAIYILGIFGFFLHLLFGHLRAISIIRYSRLKELFGAQVNVSGKDVHPFSFFNKIVLSEKTLDNPSLEIIVNHELIHVKEHHTLDILFSEILFLLQWFNPFAWLIKDAMRNNLEYKTDHQITKNNNAEAYQLAMVGLAHKEGVAPFLTALNGSQLKNRIVMMKKKTENKYALLKQLVVLPLLAVLIMGLSNKEIKTEIVQAEKSIEIILDGKVIPSNHPALINIDFSKDFDGGKVTKALGVEDKVIFNTLSMDEGSESWTYYLKTRDYVKGTNPEFEEMTSPLPVKETYENLKKPEKQLFALDGKILNDEEAKTLDNTTFESATVSSGKHASNNFLISIENKDNLLILYGLQGCAFKELTFSTNDPNPSLVNELGMVSSENSKPGDNSNFLFEIVKVDNQIKLKGKTGTAWKELTYSPGSQKHLINETGVSRAEDATTLDLKTGEAKENIGRINAPENLIPETEDSSIEVTPSEVKNQLDKQMSMYMQHFGSEKAIEEYFKKPITAIKADMQNAIRENLSNQKMVNAQLNTIQNDKKVTVKGKVTDEKGNPVAGVTIIIKDTKQGTITDKQGNYAIQSDSPIESLIVVMKGYVKKEVKVDGSSMVNIVLKADKNAKMEEVAVIGYGEQNSVSTNKGFEIKDVFKNENILINASGSLENQPLYVVDGKEKASIEYLDRNDIEAISVLKGESANSLYGERGKNGAVLITTKNKVNSDYDKLPVVLNGKLTSLTLNEIDRDLIQNLKKVEPGLALIKYGDKGKDGVYEVTSRKLYTEKVEVKNTAELAEEQDTTKNIVDFGKKSPLIHIDGKLSSEKALKELNPNEIESISVLKDASATELYGDIAKDGVILVQTKAAANAKISSELELRQFIAKYIKYPLRPQQDEQTGVSKLYVKVHDSGIIGSISDEKEKDAIRIDEIVVVGYTSGDKDKSNNEILDDYSKYFNVETKHVLYQLPKLDIEEYLGKTIVITVKYKLQ